MIPPWAAKCKHCGEYLDEDLHQRSRARTTVIVERPRRGSPLFAALISFFAPGWGHIYRGRGLTGLFFWAAIPLGYMCCLLPGVFLHIFCIFDAASGD